MSERTFTEREFRDALSGFATGVAIVGAAARDGRLLGVTVNSFSAVSLDPPLILFSLGKATSSLAEFRAADAFSVNVLAEDQGHLSRLFARTGPDKWAGLDFAPGIGGAPLLEGALARFECRRHAVHEGGDHLVFIGRVLALAFDRQARPLLYFHSGYRRLSE